MIERWFARAALCSILLASACGSSDQGEVLQREGHYLFVAPKDYGPEAGGGFPTARLKLVNGCVGVDLGNGRKAVVIWPEGTTWVSLKPLVIDLPNVGQVQEGDQLVGGGDQYSSSERPYGLTIPSSCRGMDLVSFHPDH